MKESEKKELNLRDILLRDSFTASEKLHFIALFLVLIILSWSLNNQSIWVSSFIFLIGLTSIFNLKIHDINNPFIIDKLWKKYFYYNIPALIILFIYLLGSLDEALVKVSINEEEYLLLSSPNWLGSTITFKETCIFFLGSIFSFSLVTQILIIPKSLHFISKFLFWCSINALLSGIIGFIFKAANLSKPLFTTGTKQGDYFSFFPYDSDWACFALLWMFVSYGLAKVEFIKNKNALLRSNTSILLSACIILGLSGIIVEPSFASLALILSFAYLCKDCVKNFGKFDPVFNQIKPYILGLIIGSISYGIYILNKLNFLDSTVLHLRESSLAMISDNYLFGWGTHSFQKLLPFYSNNNLLNRNYESVPSSVLNFIVEYGFVGFIAIISYICFFFIKYYLKKQKNDFSDTLFIGLFLIVLISFFENTFYNSAVSFSFLLISFFAIRWSLLIYKRVDEVDTNNHLITKDTLRNVPVVTNPKKEIFK